jgi:nitroreductase
MDAIEALKTRRSVRRYLPKKVTRGQIEAMLDAARFAPTACNAQPWEFVVITGSETRARIAELGDNCAFLEHAPACVAVFCRETDHGLEDGCAAVQSLLIAATALGLASCWVAGAGAKYAPEVAKLLGARGHHRLIALVALGYAAEESTLRPPRRLLEDVVHWERF